MTKHLRRIGLSLWLLGGIVGGLASAGCNGTEPPPSPSSEQYKEAKKRGDAARAKEYGRRSIDDKKATVNVPEAKKG